VERTQVNGGSAKDPRADVRFSESVSAEERGRTAPTLATMTAETGTEKVTPPGWSAA
jgi:hypothetical protein